MSLFSHVAYPDPEFYLFGPWSIPYCLDVVSAQAVIKPYIYSFTHLSHQQVQFNSDFSDSWITAPPLGFSEIPKPTVRLCERLSGSGSVPETFIPWDDTALVGANILW